MYSDVGGKLYYFWDSLLLLLCFVFKSFKQKYVAYTEVTPLAGMAEIVSSVSQELLSV